MDSETDDKARLTPEASEIRKPPRPPLRVGLAMQDGERFSQAEEVYAELEAILKKRIAESQQDENDLFEL